MSVLTHRLSSFEKIELKIFLFLFALAIVDIIPEEIFYLMPEEDSVFWSSFLGLLTKGTTVFLSFLLINFEFLPNILNKVSPIKNAILGLIVLLILYLVSLVSDSNFFQALFFFIVYTGIKYSIIFFFLHLKNLRERFSYITTGRLIIFILGIIVVSLFAGNTEREIVVFLGIAIFSGLFLYVFSFHRLIPHSLREKKPIESYFNKIIFILLIMTIPVGTLGLVLTKNTNVPVPIVGFNFFVQIIITAPLSWWLFEQNQRKKEEILLLKKDLNQSNANIDFLRSQINPHFLFNALNTLYATALQEDSTRTSDGIQRLGDMMRFMLHENFKEKILLSQEIEYLNNYIDLQKIKTDSNPQVRLEINISLPEIELNIAPMLLIPFVENAFKHGASFKYPSPILVHLKYSEKKLNLKVSNLKHKNSGNDPEREKGGIGLINVKQRLLLLYPDRHKLVINDSEKKFSIDLTVELD